MPDPGPRSACCGPMWAPGIARAPGPRGRSGAGPGSRFPGGSANPIAPAPAAYRPKPVMRAPAGSKACHADTDPDAKCADRNTRRRDGGRRSYGPAEQLASHHRTVGLAPGDDLQAVPGRRPTRPHETGCRHDQARWRPLDRPPARARPPRRPRRWRPGSRLPSHRGDGRHGARTSTGWTTPAGHRPASGTRPASARPARRAGPARTSRRPARRQRPAGPAAAPDAASRRRSRLLSARGRSR